MNESNDNPNMMKREDAMVRLFGEVKSVWHEKTARKPHVDVYGFSSDASGRDFVTLVTSGMSDRAMNVPSDVPPEYSRRVELVFYCTEPKTEYAEFLRRLAHFPFDRKTWFGNGHTMETTSISLLGCKDAEALLFIPSPIMPDGSLSATLQIDGDPVSLLWVVPITMAECQQVRTRGSCETLVRLLNQQGRPNAFDSCRPLRS